MRLLLRDAVRYAFASGSALAVDVSVLWALVQYASLWYLAAATISFMSGIVVAYILSVTMVFSQRRLRDRRTEFVTFATIGGAGLAINAAVIWLSVHYVGLYFLAAKCVAAAFTFTFNFLARRQILFAPPSPQIKTEPYGLQR